MRKTEVTLQKEVFHRNLSVVSSFEVGITSSCRFNSEKGLALSGRKNAYFGMSEPSSWKRKNCTPRRLPEFKEFVR